MPGSCDSCALPPYPRLATLLAALSHTLGGGAAPHALLILAIATLVTPLSAVLVGVRQSRGRVALAVFLAQGAFHVLFQLLGAPTGTTSIGGGGGGGGGGAHSHHLDVGASRVYGTRSGSRRTDAVRARRRAVLTTILCGMRKRSVRIVARWVDALFRRASRAGARDASPTASTAFGHRRLLRRRRLGCCAQTRSSCARPRLIRRTGVRRPLTGRHHPFRGDAPSWRARTSSTRRSHVP